MTARDRSRSELRRLLSLIGYLRQPRTSLEIAARYNVTDRTVRRDLAMLRSIGCDLRATKLPSGEKQWRLYHWQRIFTEVE